MSKILELLDNYLKTKEYFDDKKTIQMRL